MNIYMAFAFLMALSILMSGKYPVSYGCMDVRMHFMYEWTHVCVNECMYGCMDVWMYG